jgi:hypothetical protein
MFGFHLHHKSDVLDQLSALRTALANKDPGAMKEFEQQASANGALDADAIESLRTQAVANLDASIAAAQQEDHTSPDQYQSHDKLTSLVQSSMNGTLHTHSHIGDRIPAKFNLFGQGNAVVWAPTGIAAVLEHFKDKAPFKQATAKSRITVPAQCKIAILGDWGADNDHAQTLATLVKQQNPDYVIHLGDIYYAGTEPECQKFLDNWPLRDASGAPKQGYSFALNGNHEMYSEGRYYFTTVLDGFGQEASYFSLANDWWQIFGLDTAYVPFSISGGSVDANLKCQWDFLVEGINASPSKKNILLSHNQPVSAFVKESVDAAPLREEYNRLLSATHAGAVYGWFFGHEHRCTIYDDPALQYKARLLGNGAIPHDPQTETEPQTDKTGIPCTRFAAANHGRLNNGPLALCTFAVLSLNRDRITVDYINEDGSMFYQQEIWAASENQPLPQTFAGGTTDHPRLAPG